MSDPGPGPLALMERGKALANEGHLDDALAAYDEALCAQRQLLTTTSEHATRNDLGRILTNQAMALQELSRNEEALAAAREAIRIRRDLLAEGHEQYRQYLSNALRITARAWVALGDPVKADAALRRAVVSAKKAARRDPEHLERYVGSVLERVRLLARSGQFDAALHDLDAAMTFIRSREDRLQDEAVEPYHDLLVERHTTFEAMGNCRAACEAADFAVKFAREKNRTDLLIRALVCRADSFVCLNERGRAIDLLQEAVDLSNSSDTSAGEHAWLLLHLGSVCESAERWLEAIDSYTHAIDMFRTPMTCGIVAGWVSELASALVRRGDCYINVDPALAVDDLRDALAIWDKLPPENLIDIVRAKGRLSAALCRQGQHSEAAALAFDAAELLSALGFDDEEACSLYSQLVCSGASCAVACGDIDAALTRIDGAIATTRASQRPFPSSALAELYVARAEALVAATRAAQGVQDTTVAIALLRGDSGNVSSDQLAMALHRRAALNSDSGEPDLALRDIDECISMLRAGTDADEVSQRRSLVQALRIRADILEQAGRCAEAAGTYDEAISASRCWPPSEFTAEVLHGRGITLRHVGRIDECVAVLEQSVATYESVGGSAEARSETIADLADALAASGEMNRAIENYERALAIAAGDDTAGALALKIRLDYGIALSRVDRDAEALVALDAFVEAAEANGSPAWRERLARAHHWRGASLETLHRCAEAADAFGAEAAMYERIDRSSADPDTRAHQLEALGQRATSLVHAGREDDAVSVIRYALREVEDDDSPAAMSLKGRLFQSLGNVMQTLEDCEEAAKAFWEATCALDRAYRITGDHAPRCHANDARLRFAQEMLHLGYVDDALQATARALAEANELARDGDRSHLATVAEAMYVTALARDAANDAAGSLESVDEAIGRWTALAEAGDNEALRALSKACAHRAHVLVELGRFDEAEDSARQSTDWAQRLAGEIPADVEHLAHMHEHRADILDSVGKPNIARWHRAEAEELRRRDKQSDSTSGCDGGGSSGDLVQTTMELGPGDPAESCVEVDPPEG